MKAGLLRQRHFPYAGCYPSQKANVALGHGNSEQPVFLLLHQILETGSLASESSSVMGEADCLHSRGLKEGRRRGESTERSLWPWELRSVRPPQDASRRSCWVVQGVKSSKVRWSQVPILTPLFANCKAGAVFLCLFFLNNTSLRLSFFQLNEGNILTPVYLWWELKMR